MNRVSCGLLLACMVFCGPAFATSSAWVQTEGGAVRLVTTGLPDAEGKFSGVLDIMLKPGWKTYWRDPGGAGVPPSIDISRSGNVASAELSFPAPARHDEGDFTWAGYGDPVAFPILFRAGDPSGAVTLDAEVFLGICQTICIPVKAQFQFDPAYDASNAEDAQTVQSALAALPSPASADFGAKVMDRAAGLLTIQARVPGDPAGADIFLSADGIFTFGTPQRRVEDGRLEFTVEVSGPDVVPPGSAIAYTLVSGSEAVEGTLE